MLRGVVDLVREHYDAEIPILFAADSGFFDQKIFDVLEELGVGYIVTGGQLYDIGDSVAHRFVRLSRGA